MSERLTCRNKNIMLCLGSNTKSFSFAAQDRKFTCISSHECYSTVAKIKERFLDKLNKDQALSKRVKRIKQSLSNVKGDPDFRICRIAKVGPMILRKNLFLLIIKLKQGAAFIIYINTLIPEQDILIFLKGELFDDF